MKPIATTAPANANPAAWPISPAWKTWEPTADRHMIERPVNIMQSVQFAPHAEAVAQADFAFGGNFMAHGVLDVFRGIVEGRSATLDGALALAQSIHGVQGILGVFRDDDAFAVHQLLVGDANRRASDIRDGSDTSVARPMPERLVKLAQVGEPNGSWGHGDYRSLSALRFTSDDLLAFVGEGHQVVR